MVLGRGRGKVGSPYPAHITSGLGEAGKFLKPGEALSVSLSAFFGIPTPKVSRHNLPSSQATCQGTGWGSCQVSAGDQGVGQKFHS